jgi:hypothetical protein
MQFNATYNSTILLFTALTHSLFTVAVWHGCHFLWPERLLWPTILADGLVVWWHCPYVIEHRGGCDCSQTVYHRRVGLLAVAPTPLQRPLVYKVVNSKSPFRLMHIYYENLLSSSGHHET